MTRIGITGHQGLPTIAVPYIIEHLRSEINKVSPLVGIGSLAEGSDQIFAREVLSAGGTFNAVIPSQHYEDTFSDADQRANYDSLLKRATKIELCDFAEPSEAAFYAAGQQVVDRCDKLIAVWDGKPSRGHGGTADIVAYARRQHRPLVVIWPVGVSR